MRAGRVDGILAVVAIGLAVSIVAAPSPTVDGRTFAALLVVAVMIARASRRA